MSDTLTLTAVFTRAENGWTMAQLAEWPAVVTCGRTIEEAREMLLDAAREMVASYRDEGSEPAIVRPGDLVLADDDGVVVVPGDVENEAVAAANERARHESTVLEELLGGATRESVWARYRVL